MQDMVRVVVDAMGGDLAPVEPVRAAVDAVKERDDIQVILTGQEEVIYSELKKYLPDGKKAGDRSRAFKIHLSKRKAGDRAYRRSDRNGRTACHGNSQEKRFFDRKRYEYG